MKREPKYSVEFDSRGHRNVVMDYRGTDPVPERPALVKCDYCCRQVDRLWCYRVRPVGCEVSAGKKLVYDGGSWCGCVFCHPMVASCDIPLLVARVRSINQEARHPDGVLERIYSAIFDAMEDGYTLWRSGEPWPPERQQEPA